MASIRLTWVLPTPTARQRPIDHVRIEARLAPSLPWTEINQVAAPGTELLVADLAPGDWSFQGIVVDTLLEESTPVEAIASISFDAPDPLVTFTATVE